MRIPAHCSCGKRFLAKEKLAGRRVQCPKCGGVIRVPLSAEAGEVSNKQVASQNSAEPAVAEVAEPVVAAMVEPVTASKSVSAESQKTIDASPVQQLAPSERNPWELVGVLGCFGFLFATIFVAGGVGLYLIFSPANTTSGPAIAENSNLTQPMGASQEPWFVLSAFSFRRRGFETEFSVDWQLQQGSPQSSDVYVWIVESVQPGSEAIEFFEFPMADLRQRKGSLSDVGSGRIGLDRIETYIAMKLSYNNYKPISGRLKPGGKQTESSPPKSPAELAGDASSGRAVALARPRIEGRIGLEEVMVDYQVLDRINAFQVYWVLEAPTGEGVEFDVSFDFQNRGNASGTLIVQLSPMLRHHRPLKMYLEARGAGVQPLGMGGMASQGKVVSNVVTLD